MDDSSGFVGHDTNFEQAAGAVCTDDEQTNLAVIFLLDNADCELDCVSHVSVRNVVFPGAWLNPHI